MLLAKLVRDFFFEKVWVSFRTIFGRFENQQKNLGKMILD